VLLAQMIHFFAVMLWIAGVLAFVAGMPQLGVAIFVIVAVNGLFAFAQEQRAERASERLRDLLPVRVVALRDGHPHEIDAADVVVDDVILLSAGDRVVADVVAFEAHGLEVDESTLTGESELVEVGADSPMWAGTFIVSGEGRAQVTATGAETRLGGIARLTATADRPPGPLALELNRIVRTMAAVTLGCGAAFFGLTLFTDTPPSDGFLFAVGVTVALVPEGLLPTLTLSLSMGAQRMAGRRALVRHLQAVETLGSTTFICTDKTGTLTRNEMAVVQIWTPAGSVELEGEGYEPSAVVHGAEAAITAAARAAVAATASSQGQAVQRAEGWVALGDPMEAAIDAAGRRLDPDRQTPPEAVRRYSFDPRRRRASAVVAGELLVKGAPDSVLPRCDDTDAGPARQVVDHLAGQGLRVLAVARRDAAALSPDATADEAERGLELLGLIGLHDPPRTEVGESIAACRSAGIKLAMITGDHPETARAIAEEIGLSGPDGLVVTGDDLPDDDTELGRLLDRDGVVVSRATPEHKLRIARALQGRGHVVAMTGDGVNDGPALREADIGVAMGASGTDVAREAADLVLLDDNFATIVAAIEEGRATFTNIRRFLTYHLTDNVAELTPFVVWALSGGRFPLAIGVLQVLCLDIVTDLLPALALGAERPSPGLLDRPIQGRHLIDAPLLRRVFLVLGPTEATVSMTAFVVGMLAAGWQPGDPFPTGTPLMAASGAAFAAVVLGQVANAQACRSATRTPRRLGWTTNRLMNLALVVQIALLAALLWIPPLGRLLGQTVPPVAAGLVSISAIPAVLAADALHKRARRRSRRRTFRAPTDTSLEVPQRPTSRSAPAARPPSFGPGG
jgi:calcium-translocating P-type ATPase